MKTEKDILMELRWTEKRQRNEVRDSEIDRETEKERHRKPDRWNKRVRERQIFGVRESEKDRYMKSRGGGGRQNE